VNFIDKNGGPIDHRLIEEQAGKVNISLRTGCFCNPGAGEIALRISRAELDVCFTQAGHESRLSIDDFRLCIDGKNSGAVRISIGLVPDNSTKWVGSIAVNPSKMKSQTIRPGTME
jgi:hypothetical protein